MDKNLERATGFEPATNGLEGRDSTTELRPPWVRYPTPYLKTDNSILRFRIQRIAPLGLFAHIG